MKPADYRLSRPPSASMNFPPAPRFNGPRNQGKLPSAGFARGRIGEGQALVMFADLTPAAGHGFAPRIEADAVGTVDMQVTEQ